MNASDLSAAAAVATAPSVPSTPPAASSPAADAVAAAPPIVASVDAKRIAGAILEVLAGVRSITDAAVAIGVSPARYYQLEARALAGLIAACEPRPVGRPSGVGLQAEIDRLRAERDRLREEAARYQTLARIAQSAFGPPTTGATAATRAAPANARTRRVTTVRALKLARDVRGERSTMTGAASTTPVPRSTPSADQAGG